MGLSIPDHIHFRSFLVGCPRSGTTLLQSLLAAHPGISSLPETHFIAYVAPGRPWLRRLGIASRNAPLATERLETLIGHQVRRPTLPLISNYVDSFVRALDRYTLEKQGMGWLEKTPRHLHCVELLSKYVRRFRCIHILRNGKDTIASLHHVSQHHPETWTGTQTLDDCISRWKKDVRRSLGYLNDGSHFLLRYEQLVQDPEPTLRDLCNFLGIHYFPEMLSTYSNTLNSLITDHEPWKENTKKPIEIRSSTKFHTYLDSHERDITCREIAQESERLDRVLPPR